MAFNTYDNFLILICTQVFIALVMTIIANKFNIRYLGDVTILLWIALVIFFCLSSSSRIDLFFSIFSVFISTGIYTSFRL